MPSSSNVFSLDPFSIPIDDVTVSGTLQQNILNNCWDVTIVISRAPNQRQMNGVEIEAQLLDVHGRPFTLLERPAGPLVEAGGSLGVSANALFRFLDSKTIPAKLVVTYRGKTVNFDVVSRTD
jgi:hypothetical protein